MEQWNIIQPEQLERSPFQMIGKDWMLITAEKEGKVNTMTASWGGMGVLWRRNVVFVFVRHSRHTYGFLEAADGFSCTFYPEQYRQALSYCGTVSGRDEDKIAHCGFTVDRSYHVRYGSIMYPVWGTFCCKIWPSSSFPPVWASWSMLS